MPFTAATLTAFWTNNAQMGLVARTRTQMQNEGLVVPQDFEDFAEKEDLDALFKILLKPAKIPGGAAGALIEVASYVIPAKSQIRIDGARKMVLYYILIGRPLEPADMMWPVIKNFVEQYKALMEKKRAEVGGPPRLTKDKLVYKWLEEFSQYLSSIIGVRNAPYTYLTRPEAAPPAILGPRALDQPYSEEYTSIEQEMRNRVTHDHTLGRSDNSKLFQLIEKSVQGHDVSATIAPFKRTEDGRAAFLAIKSQHAGKAVWDRVVRESNSRLQTGTWSGTTSTTLLQHTSLQRKSHIQLMEAAEHVPTEVPGPRQRVTFLLDSLKTDNPKMLAGIAAIEQDELDKRVNFENAVTYLLPFDPVAAKNSKAKGLGVNVSATDGKPSGGVTKGSTGVELRWHESEKFKLLPKDQQQELQAWKATQPKYEGGARKRKGTKPFTRDKSKRAKVGSTKATTKLFEAMTESHDAQMELMNVKLASLVSSGVPGVLPPVGAPKVGAAVGFNPALYGPPPVFHQLIDPIAVQAEKARVAAVNFKNILKPPSKKTAP
jgi:hypothetical protein